MLIDFLESKGICTRKEYEEYIDAIELANKMSNEYIGFKPDVIDIKNKTNIKFIYASRKLRLSNHILTCNGVILTCGKDEDYYYENNKVIFNVELAIYDKIIIYWFY